MQTRKETGKMTEKSMTQEQRLDLLVEAFKADSVTYKDIQTPEDTEGKRRLLRSLMNIRMPGEMDERILAVQDEYLRDRLGDQWYICIQ